MALEKPKKISEILQFLESKAPRGTAESWDNVGLLLGDPSWETSGAIVSIDLTPETLREAKARKYRLIVNHHPCIFPRGRGLSRVVGGQGGGISEIVFEALREGIAVIASHTNFDQCAMEVVQTVADGLGAKPMGRLLEKPAGSLLKLVVFVPTTHIDAVRAAVCEAGAGQIGNYDFCTFSGSGEGTFRGGEGTNPFLGSPGRLESASELRLETILPRGMEKSVIKAMLKAHPYEEVAYDLYPVEQAPPAKSIVRGMGYGFWGEFESPRAFSEVLKDVRDLFTVSGFLLTDPPPANVKRIAFAAGKGASFVETAASLGVDLFITGEAGYHTALDGSRKKMAVLELGHRESEKFFLQTMSDWLKESGTGTTVLNVPTQKIWAFDPA